MKQLKEYEQACDSLARYFTKRYFGKDTDSYWISKDVGDVWYVNDRFFDMKDIVDYLRYHYTAEQMFAHNDYSIVEMMEGRNPKSIRDYKKLK